MNPFILPVLGSIGLVFRIWVAENKLKKELDFRRRYFSRILALFFCISLIYNLTNTTFNLICVWSIPFLIFAILGWDVQFFKEWKENKHEWTKVKRWWLFLERITLHIPQFIQALLMVIMDYPTTIFGNIIDHNSPEAIFSLIYATILTYSSYMIFDSRFSEKRGWPLGRNLALLAIIPWFVLYLLVLL